MDFVIAIPSYKRPKDCQKSLRVLQRCNLLGVTTLFVTEGEHHEYKEECAKAALMPANIVIGVVGLLAQRRYIYKHYPEGTNIFCMDDDIDDYINRERNSVDVGVYIKMGFDECKKNNCRMFGFYPVPNPFFMKDTITNDLKFCVGSSYGIVKLGLEPLTPLEEITSVKEDYFRTCAYYKQDKKLIRINFISPKTRYLKNKGGLESLRTIDNYKVAAELLQEWYPEYVRLYVRERTGITEIKLKNKPIKL